MTASRGHAKQVIHVTVIQVNVMDVVFQSSSWFKFYFPLVQTHYHTLPYPKTKENKIQTKEKIEPQHGHYY